MCKLFKKKDPSPSHSCYLHLAGWKRVPDPEDMDGYWLESPDGLRLVFRAGQYVGFYCTTLTEPMGRGGGHD